MDECLNWTRAFARKYRVRPRYVKLYLEDINGHSIFIPRYLSPVKPPAEIYTKDDNRAIERAARFVSLIPYIDDS